MRFDDLPIKQKLIGVILLTSLSVLVITCIALLSYELYSYKTTTRRSLSTLASMIAANSAAALIYDDEKVTQEILSALRAEPEITAAALFDKTGVIRGTYPTNIPASAFPPVRQTDSVQFRGMHLILYKPVYQAQTRVGTLFLQGDLQGMYRRFGVYAMVLVAVFAGSGGIALLLSNFFQRRISGPMLSLAETAKVVSERRDYSVRARKLSNDEMGDLTDAFNSMLDQIERSHLALKASERQLSSALRSKDAFLATLSHELRTPLNPVLLLASDAAENSQIPPNLRAVFETIRKNVELEARLIDDLLDLTRIAGGKLTLDLRPHDAHEIFADAVDVLREELEQREIELVQDLAAGRHLVLVDDVRLQQVFWNVLRNAVKFTPKGGRICVQTRASADLKRLVISVVDNGIGMTPDELERVFEAFSQGNHAGREGSARFGGMGLGLAISRSLMERLNGSIRAESAGRGKGCTLILELPLAPMEFYHPPTPAGRITHPATAPVSVADSANSRRVLLVEDHEATRVALAQLLRARGFQTVTAASMAEARNLARADHFDILISDIGLPDGSGYDLMAELRGRPGLRAIALTGYGMEQDVARTQAAGFVAHLTKPIRVQTLDCALAKAMEVCGQIEPGASADVSRSPS
jgi:signal transduction histidine kinase/CheY-like chemotaxis protein